MSDPLLVAAGGTVVRKEVTMRGYGEVWGDVGERDREVLESGVIS